MLADSEGAGRPARGGKTVRRAFFAVVILAALTTAAFGQAQYYFEFQGPLREVPANCST